MRSILETTLFRVVLIGSILSGCSDTREADASQGITRTTEVQRPNILFILSDDQAFSAIGASGDHRIDTPNLDRLARAGTRFTHVFNQGSWSPAVCKPSRAMINTGRNRTQPVTGLTKRVTTTSSFGARHFVSRATTPS